jgi:hypothetical protein
VQKCGCIGEGEIMTRKFGDLPFGVESKLILIVQPRGFFGLTGDGLLTMSVAFVREYLQQAIDLYDLCHVTSLHCTLDEGGKPLHTGPECGGVLRFSSGARGKSKAGFCELSWHEYTVVNCSKCGADFESSLTMADWSNMIFHLAFKQMFPNLKLLNFVNCNAFKDDDQLFSRQCEYTEDVRKLGVVSVSPDVFVGTMNDGYHDSACKQRFSLGFMAVFGLNTINGFDGMDRWVQLLVSTKFELTKKFHEDALPYLIGPKPSV